MALTLHNCCSEEYVAPAEVIEDTTHPGNFRYNTDPNVCYLNLTLLGQNDTFDLHDNTICNRMSILFGYLWISSKTDSQVYIYDSSGFLNRIISCLPYEVTPKSYIQTRHGFIVIACAKKGLYCFSGNGDYIQHVADFKFCDVTVNNDYIFALKADGLPVIHIFEDDPESGVKFHSVIQIPKFKVVDKNTIIATDSFVAVCSYEDCRLILLTRNGFGRYITFSEVYLPFTEPYLCGVDNCGHILMCSGDTDHLYVTVNLSGPTEWVDIALPKWMTMNHLSDVIVDKSNNVWCMLSKCNQLVKFHSN